jgi:hypothetical protein
MDSPHSYSSRRGLLALNLYSSRFIFSLKCDNMINPFEDAVEKISTTIMAGAYIQAMLSIIKSAANSVFKEWEAFRAVDYRIGY